MTKKKKRKMKKARAKNSRAKNVQFTSGAERSGDVEHVRFDLITPVGLERLARRYALGAEKYADRNWEKGLPASDCINHVRSHINNYLAGNKDDDDLAGAAWGLFAIMHYEEVNPECIDIPSRE